jgi:uncharacterized protein (DUF58 family)
MKRQEFHYRVPWASTGAQPGAHRSVYAGEGQTFWRLAPFSFHPDPRRLDLRATIRDPAEDFWVRLYRQRGRITVHAVVDLSASMGYPGTRTKLAVVADFVAALALSSYRNGDAAGFVGLSAGTKAEFLQPPTRQPGQAFELAKRLRVYRPRGTNANGLQHAGRYLPQRRGLVFLLSDFHFSQDLLRRILFALALHDVVPVVIWDPEEMEPTASGLALLQDLEQGTERFLWLRPGLRCRWRQGFEERRAGLTRVFRTWGREPLFLYGDFDADRVTRYFHGD